MGFFDEYEDVGGGSWVSGDEKAEMAAEGTPFLVERVARQDSQYGERYVLRIVLDGEERLLGFPIGTVDSRDRFLEALQDYRQAHADEPATEEFALSKVGRSYLIGAAASS